MLAITVDWRQVLQILLVAACYEAFVFLTEAGGYSAGLPGSYWFAINAKDGGDFDGGAGEERLFARIELRSGYWTFYEGHVLIFDQVNDGVAGNAVQDVRCQDWSIDDSISDYEDIFPCSLGNVSVVIKE